MLLESYSNERDTASYSFSGFRSEVVATRPGDVRLALGEVEEAVGEGLHAAGYVAYEAASGLDPVLVTGKSGRMPLVWFGIFENRDEVEAGSSRVEMGYRVSTWEPSISRTTYDNTIQRIRTFIKAGDSYQVNYTLRMRSTIEGDTQTFYGDLCKTQRTPYSAFIDTGEYQILSTSPELFFSLEKGILTARPMKGTGCKGRWEGENGRLVDSLRQSPKDRAENLMIVDLLRNDLGRISRTGSVKVKALWEVEQYQTINQMTSTIFSEILPNTGLVEMFASLFPCGSVTGAPKSRTMEIISELECSPREIYTGCIGYVSPGMEARFNVAIRTVVIDKSSGVAEFGVGGGITYDSTPDGEYNECLVKAKMLSPRKTDFKLLETIKWDASGQYFLLSRHLDRLVASSRYFGFSCDISAVRKELADLENGSDSEDCTVRLLLNREGEIQVESQPLRQGSDKLRVGFASSPVNSQDEMLFHKTTDRAIYEARLADNPEWDEVILQNERGEVTECCIGNLVAGLDGKLFTPPVECGLLPGTFRAELIERSEVTERVLSVEDVRRADEAFLVNSVRGWVPLDVVG